MNKKGQCGLRVGFSSCTTPTVRKATIALSTIRCVQFAFHQRGSKVNTASSIYILGIANRSAWSWLLKQQTIMVVFLFFFYLALATPLLFAVVLKGLTSLCGSRSLSCTDLINNFYQPLAQEISREWAVGGRGGSAIWLGGVG